jgi:DNA-binding transcriptional LysR family regulator
MDRFTLMQSFAAVVRAGSYSAAARALGVSRALVSKRIQDLEEALGVRLLNRDSHSVSTTATGADYYESCSKLLAELAALEERLQARRGSAHGALKILSSKTFAERILGPVVTDFCLAHPGISIQLTLGDREQAGFGLDLVAGGFDMAVGSLRTQHSELIARPIATLERVLVAAPAYLAAEGAPRLPADLASRNCLDPSGTAAHRWDLSGPGGRVSLHVSGSLSVNSSAVIRDAALKGLGIARLSTYLVAEHLAAGTLRRVLESWTLPERTLHVTYPRDRQRPLRMRLFIDFLAKRLKAEPRAATPLPLAGRGAKRHPNQSSAAGKRSRAP